MITLLIDEPKSSWEQNMAFFASKHVYDCEEWHFMRVHENCAPWFFFPLLHSLFFSCCCWRQRLLKCQTNFCSTHLTVFLSVEKLRKKNVHKPVENCQILHAKLKNSLDHTRVQSNHNNKKNDIRIGTFADWKNWTQNVFLTPSRISWAIRCRFDFNGVAEYYTRIPLSTYFIYFVRHLVLRLILR